MAEVLISTGQEMECLLTPLQHSVEFLREPCLGTHLDHTQGIKASGTSFAETSWDFDTSSN